MEASKQTNSISPAAILILLAIRLSPIMYSIRTVASNSYFFRSLGRVLIVISLADNAIMTSLIYLNSTFFPFQSWRQIFVLALLAISIATKLSLNMQKFMGKKEGTKEETAIDLPFLVMLGELCVKIYIEDSQNIETRKTHIIKLFSLLRRFKLDRNPDIRRFVDSNKDGELYDFIGLVLYLF